jgi:sugar phosphate isomerase/epimerase
MDRRSFITKGIAAAAAAYYGLNSPVFSAIAANTANMENSRNNNRIGIQLYSIREYLSDDFRGSLQKLANIGFSHAEAYGFDGNTFLGKTLKETSAIMKDLGMKLSGTHGGTGVLPKDVNAKEWDYWRKSALSMKEAGGNHIVQAWLPAEKTLDDLKGLTEQFNKAGEICKKSGIKFGYHNHYTEFKKVEGQVILNFLIENTDPSLVFFQLDMGHAVNGGGDILEYLRKYPKRFLSWHASDFKKGQDYTELGHGDVPYDELFKLAKSYGVEDLTMEHESGEDRFDICKSNFDFLAQYSWSTAKK